MKACIKNWFGKLSKTKKQWLWFIALWFSGILAVAAISYSLRGFMKLFY